MIKPMEHKTITLGFAGLADMPVISQVCDAMSDDGWRLISTHVYDTRVFGVFRRPRRDRD